MTGNDEFQLFLRIFHGNASHLSFGQDRCVLCRDEVKVLLVLWMKILILDGHLINVQLAQALTFGILVAM